MKNEREERARALLAGQLRAIGIAEPRSGFTEMADELMRGELGHVQTWNVLDAMLAFADDEIERSALRLIDAAERLDAGRSGSGKRIPQIDMHTIDVLERHAWGIRAMKGDGK